MRCLGCMKEFDALDKCPFCGYEVGSKAEKSNYLAPGTMLSGSYLIGRTLGSGGFGITYIGWDHRNSRPVAIKEYLPGVFAYRTPGLNTVSCYDKESERKFKAGIVKTIEESNCLARLNSLESVVSVYNCVEENGTVYIIMEYLEGKTLKEVLEGRGKFTFDEALDIMAPILEALSEVHEENIIHRDISPDNIFICNDGRIKLIDFGAARDSFSDEKSLSVVLKRGYAPKEQYSSSAMQGPWTDIYACAATLYRMLTGTVPQESLERDITDNLLPLSEMGVSVPDYAEAAIMQSLAIDYRKRIFSSAELLQRLCGTNGTAEEAHEAQPAPSPGKEKPAAAGGSGQNKKKKVPVLFIILALVIIAGGSIAAAVIAKRNSGDVIVDSGSCGSGVIWSLSADGSIDITGTGRMSAYDNPVSVPWADSIDKIKKVTVSGGVQNVGKNAFYSCPNLEEIVLSPGIQSIDEAAFCGCPSVKEAILPDTVTVINTNAFSDCSSLKSIHIPASVTSFGEGFLDDTSAFICSDSPECDGKAYALSHGIKFVECKGHVIKIESNDISTALPSSTVTVTETTTSAVMMSGLCGPSLKWELSSEGILRITGAGDMDKTWKPAALAGANAAASPGWRAYSNKITTVIVDEGAVNIGSAAFSGCTLIKSVSLPSTVSAIGAAAFEGCTELDTINIPSGVTSIGEQAFKDCKALQALNLDCHITSIGKETFSNCTALNQIILPQTLTSIGPYAFNFCLSLIELNLPLTVKEIGSYAFCDCSSLTRLRLPNGLRDISTACFKGCGFDDFVIPAGVETVGDYAFASCVNMRSVTVPAGVAAIGKGTFSDCSTLTRIVLPDSVTIVGQYAFADCASLEYVHVTSNLKNIGEQAFNNTTAAVCCDALLPSAMSYCIKNSIPFERCNGRH